MQKPIKISIDTVTNDTKEIYNNIKQGDTLKMTIDIYQNSASLDLTGQTIHIIIKRSTGYDVEMVTGNANLSVSGNVITAIFKDDYLCTDAIGDTKGEIVLIDSNGESSTNRFNFTVEESLASDVAVKTADKLDTLIGINEVIADYNLNIGALAEQNALALQHETTLTGLNNTASNLIPTLESDITTGQALDVTLKDDITTGNALDVTLKQDIASGTTVHDNLIISISDGNNVIAQLQNNANWPLIQQIFDLVNKMSIGTLDDEIGDYLIDESDVQFIG